jgi:hypothetical protein
MSNNTTVGRKNVIKKDNNLQTITLIPGKKQEVHPNLRSLDYSSSMVGITDPDIVIKDPATTGNQNRQRGVSGRKNRNGVSKNMRGDNATQDKDDVVNLMSLD